MEAGDHPELPEEIMPDRTAAEVLGVGSGREEHLPHFYRGKRKSSPPGDNLSPNPTMGIQEQA